MKKYILLLFLLPLAGSCSKNSNGSTNPPPPALQISSISPTSGTGGTVVTITGTGFSTTTGDLVSFNGVAATVTAATVTQLTATAPANAGTGTVKVSVNGVSVTGPVFTYNSTPPSLQVSTLAGSTVGFADGTGTAAKFYNPSGIAADTLGNVYVADASNNRIRKITPAGLVSTFAGNGIAGYADGTGTGAEFNFPTGIAADSAGNLYVADTKGQFIRKITPAGVVTTLAGNGVAGYVDGTGTAASFYNPIGIAVDAQGNVYVGDAVNQRIRKITSAGVVSTLAGNGTPGFADGTGTAAKFNGPLGVAVDAQSNVYVADNANNCIRKITPAGGVSTLAGSTTAGYADGTGTAAQFTNPSGAAVDAQGNVYIADYLNNRIRAVSPAGVVSTLAGNGTKGAADGAAATAQFNGPYGICINNRGVIYVADYSNNLIRKIQ